MSLMCTQEQETLLWWEPVFVFHQEWYSKYLWDVTPGSAQEV